MLNIFSKKRGGHPSPSPILCTLLPARDLAQDPLDIIFFVEDYLGRRDAVFSKGDIGSFIKSNYFKERLLEFSKLKKCNKVKSLKNIMSIFILGSLLWMCSVASAETRILFMGDSITAGLGVEKTQAYPYLVGELLRLKGYEDIKIINAGISGSTSASALSRLQWHARIRPDILVLALGANDGLRGLSIKEMKTNLDMAIQYALDQGIRVILAGMEIPPNYGPEYTRAFRDVFSDLAQRHKINFMPFLLKGVGGVAKLNQPDGIHPNPDGHQVIAENILTYILENL